MKILKLALVPGLVAVLIVVNISPALAGDCWQSTTAEVIYTGATDAMCAAAGAGTANAWVGTGCGAVASAAGIAIPFDNACKKD